LRNGLNNREDINMLKHLVLSTDPESVHLMQSSRWSNSVLVTPRHSVRIAWNSAALSAHSAQSGNPIFEVPALDSISNRSLTLKERYIVATQATRSSVQNDKLPPMIEIAIGAKIMVTLNVDTDLDIANGARGVIHSIIVHSDENITPNSNNRVVLTRLPLYIFVKLDRTRAPSLSTLDRGLIPIVPIAKTFSINVPSSNPLDSRSTRKTVKCLQLPITGAYAFTDYRSQGQTIPQVIVDIATPPDTGRCLSLFNVYVALSRSAGRQTIRLLRDFDEKTFLQPQDSELLEEDRRVTLLDSETRNWWRDYTQERTSAWRF
jgi:hypothetical protein